MSNTPDSRIVETFAELARDRIGGDAPARDHGFERLQARLQATKEPRVLPWARVGALVLAAVTLVSLGSWFLTSRERITYQVENAQVAADGKLFGGSSGSRVQFSDGSRLSLWPGAQASVAELGAHGARVRIEEGTTHVAIARLPGAAWSLLAGPYTVRVTGTAFDLAWAANAQRFEITMQSGSVSITGPLVPHGLTLTVGQHMTADRELRVDRATRPEPAEARIDPPAPSAASAPAAESAAAPRVASGPTGPRPLSWRALVAAGRFSTVLQEAEYRGVSAVLSSSSLEDLSALGDAARYGRRTDLARRALLAQRSRFPNSAQARDAAFFLGTLRQDQGSVAVEWYDRYLQESPAGAYASQALGRKLMVVYGQHRAEEARQLAVEYRAKYPKGPYASTARKVLEEPNQAKAP